MHSSVSPRHWVAQSTCAPKRKGRKASMITVWALPTAFTAAQLPSYHGLCVAVDAYTLAVTSVAVASPYPAPHTTVGGHGMSTHPIPHPLPDSGRQRALPVISLTRSPSIFFRHRISALDRLAAAHRKPTDAARRRVCALRPGTVLRHSMRQSSRSDHVVTPAFNSAVPLF